MEGVTDSGVDGRSDPDLDPHAGTETADLSRDLRLAVHRQVIRDLGPLLYDAVSDRELAHHLKDALRHAFSVYDVPIDRDLFDQIERQISHEVLGYGPIEEHLADESVTEIMVNGPDLLYIERNGLIEEVPSTFVDEGHVRRVIDKIVGQVGRRIDEASPMVDARLPDGSRVHAVLPPLAVNGPYLTIRKFGTEPLTAEDLVGFGSITEEACRFLAACVQARLNIVVSGGTGTGKTTLLNVLSGFIPEGERIVTIEDAKELQLTQRHWLPLESRPANTEGRGEVTIRDLVIGSLRMRPDRIIVGESRGGEALDMLQAMNTGHDGSLTTVHANSPVDALSRIETMTLLAGFDLPVRAIRDQICSALDLIIHLARFPDGSRKVTHITEVVGDQDGEIQLADVFRIGASGGADAPELATAGGEPPAGGDGPPPTGHRPVLQRTDHQPLFARRLTGRGLDAGTLVGGAP